MITGWTMARLVLHNIDEALKTKLQRYAKRHGQSVEEAVQDILSNALHQEKNTRTGGLGTEISSLFAEIRIDFDIPELRGHVSCHRRSKGAS